MHKAAGKKIEANLFIIIFRPSVDMIPRGFKNYR